MTPISRREREISLGQARTTTTERPLIPRRCFLTRKWLWGKLVIVRKRWTFTDTGSRKCVVNKFWVDPREYTLYAMGKRTDDD